MILALIGQDLDRVLTLKVIGGHVRILVTIPLFFVCETWVGMYTRLFVEGLRKSHIVRGEAEPALNHEIGLFNGLVGSVIAELVFLALAVSAIWSRIDFFMPGTTALSHQAAALPATQWYWLVCLPAFRFLLFRMVWRLGVWVFFLWRLSRLDLKLIPTHPDRAAGLGYLAQLQGAFAVLVAAASAVVAASVAEEIAVTGADLKQYYDVIMLLLLGVAVVFIGPLFFFTPKLTVARARGLADYMDLASAYVTQFDTKWLRQGGAPEEPLLGTPDMQSLADLSNSVRVVEEMRVVPIDAGIISLLGAGCLVPMLPLLLFQFPAVELAARVIKMLVGE